MNEATNSFFVRFKTYFLLVGFLFVISLFKPLWLLLILGTGIYVGKYEFLPLLKHHSFKWLFFYPTIPVCLLFYYSWQATSWYALIYPLIAAATADTCAYVIGMLCGKHQICPIISPKKTIEGFFAGIVGLLFLHFFFYQVPYLMIVPLSFVVGTFSFLGDIFISWCKRSVGVKDTGMLLPGHGGLLDRLDSVYGVIVGLFFFWLFL